MAQHSAKAYTLPQLGFGKKHGGSQDNQQKRFEVLDRLRAVGEISVDQAGQWFAFRSAWDEKMADLHQEDWGRYFSEVVQALFIDLSDPAKQHALSEFIEVEKQRVLKDVPMLCIPDAPKLGCISKHTG